MIACPSSIGQAMTSTLSMDKFKALKILVRNATEEVGFQSSLVLEFEAANDQVE